MISETSRRVRATTCSRIARVDSGSSASASSGSSGSGWNSTSTLAGRGGASPGPASREASASTSSAAEVSGEADDPDRRAIGQRASSRVSAQTRPTTLAERWTRTASPTASSRADLEVEPGEPRAGRQRDQRGEGQAADDGQRLGRALGRLVVVGDRVGPLGAAVGLADLLQPAPRIGAQGPAERDQDGLESPAGGARWPGPRPGSTRTTHTLPPLVVGRRRADQGERVDQPFGGEDLPFPPPHRVGVLGGPVVEAAEVEQAVDHVERQLGPGVDPGVPRRSRRPSRRRRPARRPGSGRRARRGRR